MKKTIVLIVTMLSIVSPHAYALKINLGDVLSIVSGEKAATSEKQKDETSATPKDNIKADDDLTRKPIKTCNEAPNDSNCIVDVGDVDLSSPDGKVKEEQVLYLLNQDGYQVTEYGLARLLIYQNMIGDEKYSPLEVIANVKTEQYCDGNICVQPVFGVVDGKVCKVASIKVNVNLLGGFRSSKNIKQLKCVKDDSVLITDQRAVDASMKTIIVNQKDFNLNNGAAVQKSSPQIDINRVNKPVYQVSIQVSSNTTLRRVNCLVCSIVGSSHSLPITGPAVYSANIIVGPQIGINPPIIQTTTNKGRSAYTGFNGRAAGSASYYWGVSKIDPEGDRKRVKK